MALYFLKTLIKHQAAGSQISSWAYVRL